MWGALIDFRKSKKTMKKLSPSAVQISEQGDKLQFTSISILYENEVEN